MKKFLKYFCLVIAAALLTAACGRSPEQQAPLSWDECTKLPGSIIQRSYPPICVAKDGRKIAEPNLPPPTSPPAQQDRSSELPGAQRVFTYRGSTGQDALALLKKLHRVETKDYGKDLGEFVTSIEGIKPASDEFWAFYINGKSSTVGASSYQTKDGDVIEWKLEKIK